MNHPHAVEKTCARCGVTLGVGALEGLCPACLLAMNLNPPTQCSEDPDASAPKTDPPAVGQIAPLFPQLEILACMGRGGMGVVYKARQRSLNRLVALKILAPEREKDAAFGERFTREAQALARLNHPHIVTIHDFGRVDGVFYFLMEFVDGVSLSQLLQAGRVAPREALAIVPQICDALQYAHDQGIVHRDIKPENILLDRQGRVKVADFGLAKLMGTFAAEGSAGPGSTGATARPAESTRAGEVMGTPAYMAPEQGEHPASVDHRADIYSLGVVFYQMLTGELPAKPVVPPSRKVTIDVRLDEVVLRALEKQPERRYQRVGDVKTMVENVAPQVGEQGVDSRTPAGASMPRLSRLALSAAMLNALAILAGVGRVLTEAHGGGGSGSSVIGRFLIGDGATPLAAQVVPLAGTILGCVALRPIRRSRGALVGLGLALFNALLFPLLVLDGLVWWGCQLRISTAVTALFVCGLNAGLAWLVWRVVTRSYIDKDPCLPVPVVVRRRDRHVIVTAFSCVTLLLLSMTVFVNQRSLHPDYVALADSPHRLRRLDTKEVIRAAVAKPLSPWAWQELERRPLTIADGDSIMGDLTTWLRNEHPKGYAGPLHWLNNFLDHLANRALVSEARVIEFMSALAGDPQCEPLLRLREGSPTMPFRCDWGRPWNRRLMGLMYLNEMRSISIDGQRVNPAEGSARAFWDGESFAAELALPPLAPGKHKVRCEILSALAPESEMTGLASNARSEDWPLAKHRWTRTAETELMVYPRDAVIVRQTEDPDLDPVATGILRAKTVIVRREGNETRAVVEFKIDDKLPVPLSFDAELRLGEQTVSCGWFYRVRRSNGDLVSGGTHPRAVLVGPLATDIKTADIILTPNTGAIEAMPGVERMWGKRVTLRNVPVSRQDLLRPADAP